MSKCNVKNVINRDSLLLSKPHRFTRSIFLNFGKKTIEQRKIAKDERTHGHIGGDLS